MQGVGRAGTWVQRPVIPYDSNPLRLALLLVPLALAAGLTAHFLRSARAAEPEVLLDALAFEYLDHHEGGRLVAMIDVELARTAEGQGLLRVGPRAVDPNIEPVPGFQGVRGANLLAARELGRLVERGELSLVRFTGEAAEGRPTGRLLEVERGHLPERRLRDDGRIDWDARTSKLHVAQVLLATDPFGPGRHRIEVHAAGHPRLSIDVEFDAQGGRILTVHGQAGPGETDPRGN